ncbi:hypothetical protein CAL19_12815 [Bordetella genomosp. 7]|uniref:Uncharacterized protein n=1 Tax=Bordetella genomosp. 7 TaxID=1416805 RepID=A0A261QYV1_9BORD|nr:hypothetical protein CAL19_12815 [Bordetella genomosp. 7]
MVVTDVANRELPTVTLAMKTGCGSYLGDKTGGHHKRIAYIHLFKRVYGVSMRHRDVFLDFKHFFLLVDFLLTCHCFVREGSGVDQLPQPSRLLVKNLDANLIKR